METITAQQNTAETFNNAVVFDIELLNGKQTSVTTIFNNKEVDFEEIVAGMNRAFERCDNVKSIQPSMGSIRGGTFKPVFFYQKREFDRSEVLNHPFLGRYYSA
jgi:hypothetical protein